MTDDTSDFFYVRLRKSDPSVPLFDEVFTGQNVSDLRPKRARSLTTVKPEEVGEDSPFNECIQKLWDDIQYFVEGSNFVTTVVDQILEPFFSEHSKKYLIEHGRLIDERGRHQLYALPAPRRFEFFSLVGDRKHAKTFANRLPNILNPALVSHVESFLHHTIRALIKIHPKILGNVSREFDLKELLEVESVEEIRNEIIENKIRAIMADSHLAQIDWLEDKTKVKFEIESDCIKQFQQMCAIRNILTHNAGILNKTFVQSLRSVGIEIDDDQIGKHISTNRTSLVSDIYVALEVCFIISQKIWRKVDRDRIAAANNWTYTIPYKLLKRGEV